MGVIYPVGDGTKEDFNQNWYLADTFGSYRQVKNSSGTVIFTYYHSGIDINRTSGGNTDLGEKISAIGNGSVDYYHRYKHTTKGYGRHNVHKHTTDDGLPWWVHNAHCMDDSFVGEVKDVSQGDMVGKIGNSGNSYSAHLHHAIFRVDPATLRNGIDTVPRTVDELQNCWVDPEWFYNKYYGGDMSNELEVCMKDRQKFWDERDELYRALGVTDQATALEEIKRLQAQDNKVKDLEYRLKECEENNSSPVPEVPSGWSPNGYETTVYSDGKSSITTNYKKD